jgi:hypothetical protein
MRPLEAIKGDNLLRNVSWMSLLQHLQLNRAQTVSGVLLSASPYENHYARFDTGYVRFDDCLLQSSEADLD